MISTGNGGWRLAKSLKTLFDQIDAQFPIRDSSSDGTIGDTRHQATRSDHNPDGEGVVRALDITHDPAHGVDSYKLAENLRIARDPRIKYVISNRKIFGDEDYASRNGARAWTWDPYHGTNPHDMHVHVSVTANDAIADDTRPWVIGDIVSAAYPKLEQGASGEEVKEAQKLLGIAVTGMFDVAMDDAVHAFQARSGLGVDGVIGPYTWRALLADRPPDPDGSTDLPAETINAIVALAGSSPIAHYSWRNRGTAPAGYIKGMAVTFALVCRKWKAGDPGARLMAAPNSGNDNVDALSWYDSNFHALGMSNATGGLNTLRHLFVLLFGLGMRESSGNCFEGRDTSAANVSSETAEAGLFQQSHNSFSASPELAKLMAAYQANPAWGFQSVFREGVHGGPSPDQGVGAGAAFQNLCKVSPAFAVEAAAIGLRTIGGDGNNRGHWGPINRKEVELRPEVDALLAQVQQIVEAAPVPTPSPVDQASITPPPVRQPPVVQPPVVQPPVAQPPAIQPQPPTAQPPPVMSSMDATLAELEQRITRLERIIATTPASLPLPSPPLAPAAAPPPQADLSVLVQQLTAFIQAIKPQSPLSLPGSATPVQAQDQLKQLFDLLKALSGGSQQVANAVQPKLGQVNGALGQTIGNLLDGKKSAIGIIGALATSILQTVGPDMPLSQIIPAFGSSAGLGSIAMPLSLAMGAWGALGKMEKWAQGTIPPQPTS